MEAGGAVGGIGLALDQLERAIDEGADSLGLRHLVLALRRLGGGGAAPDAVHPRELRHRLPLRGEGRAGPSRCLGRRGRGAGAEREGPRWRLLLADGGGVAVSAHVVEARRRGWLPAP